jgi:hypothetical protein
MTKLPVEFNTGSTGKDLFITPDAKKLLPTLSLPWMMSYNTSSLILHMHHDAVKLFYPQVLGCLHIPTTWQPFKSYSESHW